MSESGWGLRIDAPLRINACCYVEAFGSIRAMLTLSSKRQKRLCLIAGLALLTKQVELLKSDGSSEYVTWTMKDCEGSIEVIFAYDVVKQITRIDGAIDFFTSYQLSNTIHFKFMYSVRLYELLAQWKNNHQTPIFELGVFRGQLGVLDDEYLHMSNFKKRVLDLAIKEINEHSDLTVSYTQHKKGRVIIGFSFEIKSKQARKNQRRPTRLADQGLD